MADKHVSPTSDHFDPIPPQIRQMLEAQGIELPPDPRQVPEPTQPVCKHLFIMPPDEDHATRWCRHCGGAV